MVGSAVAGGIIDDVWYWTSCSTRWNLRYSTVDGNWLMYLLAVVIGAIVSAFLLGS